MVFLLRRIREDLPLLVKISFLLAIGILFNHCTTSDQVSQVSSGMKTNLPTQPKKPPTSKIPNPCLKFSIHDMTFPYFVTNKMLVITRLLNPCQNPDQSTGYTSKTSWMAMGFPCTGGQGKISYKGHLSHPKMVSFFLSNGCPMEKRKSSGAKREIVRAVHIPETLRLAAYYPFDLQYWELEHFEDADTGHVIELRSQLSLREAWKKFLSYEPLSIRIYGRENAWVPDNQFFEVSGKIIREPNNLSFKLLVSEAKALDAKEINLVKARCQNLRPRRNCHNVFPLSSDASTP